MFGFINKMFIGLISTCTRGSFCESLVFNSKGSIKCLSLNKQPCQASPTLVDIKPDETLFDPFSTNVKVWREL